MPYFLRMMGEMRVILCRRKASQPWELPGKNPEAKKVGVSLWAGPDRTGSGQADAPWAAPSSTGAEHSTKGTEHTDPVT